VVVMVVVVVVVTGINKCSIKFVPMLAIRAVGQWRYSSTHSLPQHQVEYWLESPHGRCSSGERTSVTLLMGSFVDPTTHLKASEKM
jgi:hypothetical protein